MTFYSEMKETARELLTEFGQSMTFSTEDKGGGYDENGDPVAVAPDVDITGVGVKLNYSDIEKRSTQLLKFKSNAKIIFSTDSIPTKGMFTTLNGAIFRVVEIEALEPAGENVIYTLHVFG